MSFEPVSFLKLDINVTLHGQVPLRYGQDTLTEAVQEAAKSVYLAHGPEAFHAPKTAAAWHEAGHCVAYAAEDQKVDHTRIWSILHEGRRRWIGKTKSAAPTWVSTPETPPAEDLKNARIFLAGFAAEDIFDNRNCLPGSSIDERVLAATLANNAARKLGAEFDAVADAVKSELQGMLVKNKQIVRKVAMELLSNNSIKTPRIDKLLDGARK
jgi:hypothetical protein